MYRFTSTVINPAGVRLHLGNELLISVKGQKVDLTKDEEIKYDKIVILVLRPNEFILGSTYEKFQVPRDVVCYLEGMSAVARIGLVIHCTSGIIDGNFEEARTIVFEIKNQGPLDIVLKPKMALAMLSFCQLGSKIEQKTQKQ